MFLTGRREVEISEMEEEEREHEHERGGVREEKRRQSAPLPRRPSRDY